MDKQQAQRIVQETLGAPFDKSAFIKLTKELFNKIDESKAFHARGYVPEAYKKYVKTYERIATYTDPDNLKIDILIVYLQSETTLERARTSQRNFIAHYLKERGQKDAGLVAFVSPDPADWRFSLVKIDYKIDEKGKVKDDFTPARRWSFLVGANENSHTARSRLSPLILDDAHNPTLAELEEAFNIEIVTKEFFTEYRDLFIRVKEALDHLFDADVKIKNNFAQCGVNTVDFAKKLLGQIIFLYFLQKKGWFGVGRDTDWGTGSKQFLRELFEAKHGNYRNFFNDILEPLFYDALRIDRSHDDHYYSRFNCKIPFLNGGLFDPLNNYDWVHTDILIPNELFSNKHKTAKGDTGSGILDIFDRYNFTVKEDEPLEKEVAIDPELLGKAYEKFNAIRPDNFAEYQKALKSGRKGEESKFNKQFGVYYTPREIVHYMCQQSLINYLHAEFDGGMITYEKPGIKQTDMLGNVGKSGQLDLTIEHKEKPAIPKEDIETLIHYGERITETEAIAVAKEENISAGKQKTTKTKSFLSESIRSNVQKIDEKLSSIKVCDPAIGSGAFPVGMLSEIVRTRNVLSNFIKGPDRTTYHFKRQCIENSLYGVDIDSGAVEIAKLRLWLSLVVDEEDIKNIKPLPNLDYKIICGNSLLGVEKNLFNNELFIKLEEIKPIHFNETNPTKKQEYKKQIDGLINQITNGHSDFDFEVYFSEVFHEKGGFDVVIANPPYVTLSLGKKQKNFSRNDIEIFTKLYQDVVEYKGNTFILFIKKAYQIVGAAKVCTFIIPNTLLLNDTCEKIRKFLLNNTDIIILLNIRDKVFENAEIGGNLICIFKRSTTAENNIDIHDISDLDEFGFLSKGNLIRQKDFFNFDGFRFYIDSNSSNLVSKLTNNCVLLAEIADFYNGIKTGDNKKFISDKINNSKYKEIIRGRDVFKYKITFSSKYVLFDKELLWSNTNENKLRKNPKIVIRQTGDTLIAAIDQKGYLTMDTTHILFDTKIDIKYLLALLNSNLLNWFHKKITNEENRTFAEVKIVNLKRLPIKVGGNCQNDIIKNVDNILHITQSEDYLQNQTKQIKVKEYEKEIDKMVYALYGLTLEEIDIVKGKATE